MGGPIGKALAELGFRIPAPILKAVFLKPGMHWRETPQNLEENIMATVIRPRVLVDCDLVGGTEVLISLANCPMEQIDQYTYVYRIPKDRTQNRSIISVLSVSFVATNSAASMGVFNTVNNSTMMQAGQAVMDAHASIPANTAVKCQLIGENVVAVYDSMIPGDYMSLRCRLGNDENLSHIQQRSWRHFSRMVELAVKSYIYNNYVIELDMAQLSGGQSLGRFRDIIDTYADAEQMYQEYLTENMEAVLFMNDVETDRNFIKGLIGAFR